ARRQRSELRARAHQLDKCGLLRDPIGKQALHLARESPAWVATDTDRRHRADQVAMHRLRGWVAAPSIARQGSQADVLESLRILGSLPRRRRDRVFAHRVEDQQLVVTLEQPLEDTELVEHDAEREDVAASIECFALTLLRRHVRELALELARRGLLR